MRASLRGPLWVVVSIAACSKPSSRYDPPGLDPTVAAVSSTDTDASTSATGGGALTSGGGSGTVTSTSPTEPDGTGAPSDTTGFEMSSGGGGSDDGPQPRDGMYSSCRVRRECGPTPNLCVTIFGLGGVLVGGFCSQVGCSNAAADCDPSPGGTAIPTCVEVNVDGMDDLVCALNCEDGATCPAPMECLDVGIYGRFCV